MSHVYRSVSFGDARLDRRYQQLVEGHMAPLRRTAPGMRLLPSVAQPFAAAQAAWRFYANPRVTPPQLAAPLIDAARDGARDGCDEYALVVQDWSDLHYASHRSKADRIALAGGRLDLGSELMTSLVLSDRDGEP